MKHHRQNSRQSSPQQRRRRIVVAPTGSVAQALIGVAAVTFTASPTLSTSASTAPAFHVNTVMSSTTKHKSAFSHPTSSSSTSLAYTSPSSSSCQDDDDANKDRSQCVVDTAMIYWSIFGGPSSTITDVPAASTAPIHQLPHTISTSHSPMSSHLLPCVTRITSPEQFINLIDDPNDDRLCVVNFRASWCKACHAFAPKLRHIIQVYGDPYEDSLHHLHEPSSKHHLGLCRFADVEYHENELLVHKLGNKVEQFPTVHLYQNGELLEVIHTKHHLHTKVLDAIKQYTSMSATPSKSHEDVTTKIR